MAALVNVADQLADGPADPGELAERTKTHPNALARVLRLLASRGVFHEDGDGRFAITARAQALRTDSPTSVRDAVLMITEPAIWRPAGELVAGARTGLAAIDAVYGSPFWEVHARDAATAGEFDAGMGQWSQLEARGFAQSYRVPPDGLVVDVGGGRGRFLVELLRIRPDLRGILLDQPIVVSNHDLGQLDDRDRWQAVSGDFFESVPPDGDVYVLQYILNDWPDDQCVRILQSIRRSMKPESRVVALECVVPPGNAPHAGKGIDLVLLASFAGRVRTEAEFAELFSAAGMRLTRVMEKTGPGFLSIVEGVSQ
nr:methyltransferase [Amycolatopsis rubida]